MKPAHTHTTGSANVWLIQLQLETWCNTVVATWCKTRTGRALTRRMCENIDCHKCDNCDNLLRLASQLAGATGATNGSETSMILITITELSNDVADKLRSDNARITAQEKCRETLNTQ